MTTTYAALLRGINVGGNKKVPMAELRTLIEELGHGGVQTYLQSGNAVFSTDRGDEDSLLAAELAEAMEKHFGFGVGVLVRDHAYLRAVREACPFPADELEAKQLHVTYFSGPVDAERFASVDPAVFLPEVVPASATGRSILYAPDGLGRSKLAEALSKPRLLKAVTATTRNWNTVVKLEELTGAEHNPAVEAAIMGELRLLDAEVRRSPELEHLASTPTSTSSAAPGGWTAPPSSPN